MIHRPGPVTLDLADSGEYQRQPEIIAACTYLRRGDVAIDVGANVGLWTTMLSKAVGEEGAVHAFEPHPRNFETLIGNVQEDNLGNVYAYPWAIGADQGTARLYLHDHSRGHSLYGTGESIIVDKTSLDIAFSGFEKVNFIKINVLGLETEVLRGAEGLIRSQESMSLCVNCCDDYLRAASSSQEELIDLIFDFGFTVYLHEACAIGGEVMSAILVLADRDYCVRNAAKHGFTTLWCVK